MPKITPQIIAGNQGEAMVAYRLSKYCLVRPVTSGTDIGIDHYCETITDHQPNNHFMVQVKARATLKDNFTLTKDELVYWQRQPVPVFIFLVSSSDRLDTASKIHVIDLVEFFISGGALEESTRLVSTMTIDTDESMEKFINHLVPSATARQWLRFGVIMPVKPRVHLDYLMTYPNEGAYRYSRECIRQIGRTASMLLFDILMEQRNSSHYNSVRNHLELLLETFADDGHYDFHYSLGLSKFDRGDHTRALSSLQKALNCIESDPNITQADWEDVKNQIRIKIELSRAGLE